MFPPLHSARNTLMTQKVYVGDRSQKLIYSTLPTIGKMVARIIVDPRTLNQTVVAYDGEISISETWKAAEKVTGEDFSDYPKVSIPQRISASLKRLMFTFPLPGVR